MLKTIAELRQAHLRNPNDPVVIIKLADALSAYAGLLTERARTPKTEVARLLAEASELMAKLAKFSPEQKNVPIS